VVVFIGSDRGETSRNERKCNSIGIPCYQPHGAVTEEGESLFVARMATLF